MAKNIKNVHGAHPQAWKKWSRKARRMFNGTYENLLRIGQVGFLHPRTIERRLTQGEFDTIAWNAAFEAACQVDNPMGITTAVTKVD